MVEPGNHDGGGNDKKESKSRNDAMAANECVILVQHQETVAHAYFDQQVTEITTLAMSDLPL